MRKVVRVAGAAGRERVEVPPEDLAPALAFLQLIWRLNHAIEQLSMSMEVRLGVTAQQRMVIRCIGSRPGITPGQLAALLHLDAGTISAALARLERKRVLTRKKDAEDRRRVAIRLTPAGRGIDKPMDGTVERAVERLLSRTSAKRLAEARRVLVALTDYLDLEGGTIA